MQRAEGLSRSAVCACSQSHHDSKLPRTLRRGNPRAAVSKVLQRTRGSQLARSASSTDQEAEVTFVTKNKPPPSDTDEEKRGEALDLDPDSDEAKKQAEAERLRAAEKFMTIGTGKALCVSCGYEYEEKRGDPEYPVGPGTKFQELPGDWQCPVCGAQKTTFRNQAIKVAGFAENQQYGFGGNSMTSGQKSILIYGSLIAFFGLFLAGYLLQ